MSNLLDALNHIDEHGDLLGLRGTSLDAVRAFDTMTAANMIERCKWTREWQLTEAGREHRATLSSMRTTNAVIDAIIGNGRTA